jgi:DNA mismatch endonuclease, patch repair protein
MADSLSKSERSYRMSLIRGSDTKPEVTLRKLLHAQGFRYRKNVPGMPGRPDIVLSKYKTAVFVHGCFWHNHRGCKIANFPKTNSEFWKAKFDTNIKRDRRNARALHAAGWRVLVVWECELTPIGRAVRTAKKIGIQIRGPLGSR